MIASCGAVCKEESQSVVVKVAESVASAAGAVAFDQVQQLRRPPGSHAHDPGHVPGTPAWAARRARAVFDRRERAVGVLGEPSDQP